MLMGIGIIIIFGLIFSRLFEKIKMPGLLGMLILGIIIGPYGLDLLDDNMLLISDDIRRIALITILLRAGLGIDRRALNKVRGSAMKISAIPVILEGLTIGLLATWLLDFNFIQGGILGFIIAAVSPAVIVPAMIKLIDRGIGKEKGVPTLILAGASIDDVFAITLFMAFLNTYLGESVNVFFQIVNIPLSILLGILLGIGLGLFILKIYSRYKMEDTKKVLIFLALGIVLAELENYIGGPIKVATLLGVMAMGYIVGDKNRDIKNILSKKLNKIWLLAEIFLFTLVGSQVNPILALEAGRLGILIIVVGLMARAIGVMISLMGSNFNKRERAFCAVAYIPKATVQAALASIPLSLGVEGGDLILAIGVLSILFTAPIGAIGIKYLGERLLE